MSHPERKKTFVDPKVQGALVRRLVMHWLSFLLVASLVTFCLQILSNPFRSMGEHFQQLWWTHGPFLLVMVFFASGICARHDQNQPPFCWAYLSLTSSHS